MTDTLPPEAGLPLHVEQLWTYPIKSCAGLRLPSAVLFDTGLEWDRTWMVVDEDGEFVSQRECPRMALVHPRFHLGQLELRAPGMLPLHIALDLRGERRRVRVWDDEVDAWDMGDAAALWFTEFLMPQLGAAVDRLRLVRFDDAQRRLSSPRWTGGIEAPNRFSDGFPLLVLSLASLDDLNARLQALGLAPVGIERFRPNLVLGGLEPHDEDRLGAIWLESAGVQVQLQPVKPCARCSIPDIDPATAASHPAVSETLRRYRQDRRLMGAVTFGMNAIVRAGAGTWLHEGTPGRGDWNSWDD